MTEESEEASNNRLWLWAPAFAGGTDHADLASAPSIMFTALPMP
jgi:hypothetical protein